MKILLSGGSGYLGNALIRRLITDGHQLALLSRHALPTWATEGLPAERWRELRWDMAQPLSEHALASLGGDWDLMVHAAGANDVDSASAAEALIGSALSTRHAIDLCQRLTVRQLVYLSTFQVYGRDHGAIDETSPLEPVNDYGLTHRFAEEYLEMARRTGKLDAVILRPSNVYGAPRHRDVDRWTLVPNCFCKEALERDEIGLRSSGRQNRNFVHHNTVADAVSFAATTFDRLAGRAYNVAGDETRSIREVAEMTCAIHQRRFGKPCRLNILSDAPRETAPLSVSDSALRAAGWNPPPAPDLAAEIDTIFTCLKD